MIFQKEIAITPWQIKAKIIINNKSVNPKISNFMIVCCRKSYFKVCSNSHIPDVKLRNNSSIKKIAEKMTAIVKL